MRYVIGHNPSSYTTKIATVRLKSALVLYPRDNILIRPKCALLSMYTTGVILKELEYFGSLGNCDNHLFLAT